MNSVDRLVEYYNALVERDWPTLVNCFDLPSKVISLYGVVNFECKEQIQNVYESVLDTWRQNGIAQEFSYKRYTFRGKDTGKYQFSSDETHKLRL